MLRVSEIGGSLDDKGQICPVVVSSIAKCDEKKRQIDYIGAAITIDGYKMNVKFTNSTHEVIEEHDLDLIK